MIRAFNLRKQLMRHGDATCTIHAPQQSARQQMMVLVSWSFEYTDDNFKVRSMAPSAMHFREKT